MFDKLVNQNTSTITLKEVTDMVKTRHNDAMSVVERMQQDPDFGSATKISYHLPASHQKRAETIQTYQLNKRQSIAVAARLNVGMLMVLVDYWIEREAKESSPLDALNKLQVEYAKLSEELIKVGGDLEARVDLSNDLALTLNDLRFQVEDVNADKLSLSQARDLVYNLRVGIMEAVNISTQRIGFDL